MDLLIQLQANTSAHTHTYAHSHAHYSQIFREERATDGDLGETEWDLSDAEEQFMQQHGNDVWAEGVLSGRCEYCNLANCLCTELRGRMHALIDAVAHMQDLVVTFHRYQWVDSMDTTGLLPVDECPLAVARPGALRRWAPAPRPGRVDRDDTICYQCTNSNRACQCANMRSRNRALGDAIGCLNAFIGRARSTYRPRSPDQPSVTLIQHTIDMLMRECPLDWTTEQDGQTLFQ